MTPLAANRSRAQTGADQLIRTRLLLFVFALLLAGCTSSCNQSCTDIGCIDGLEVAFDPPLSTRAPLSIELESDVGNHSCSITVDHATPACDAPTVTLDILNDQVTMIRAAKYHPSSVHARVTQSGSVVREATLTP